MSDLLCKLSGALDIALLGFLVATHNRMTVALPRNVK